MVDFSRSFAFGEIPPDNRSFIDATTLTESLYLFTMATSTTISESFYDYSILKGPLEIHVELTNVGTTSYCIRSEFHLEGAGPRPVVENDSQMVVVDPGHLKPTPPPAWWLDKYKPEQHQVAQPLRFPRSSVPDSGALSRYPVKIAASDLDIYCHTNWSNYLRFSYDAFVDHEMEKKGREDILSLFRRTRQFSLLFLQESSVTDTLDVHLWKDPSNADLIKFLIHKGSDAICHAQIEFYPDAPDES